jgi:hypothetical protein
MKIGYFRVSAAIAVLAVCAVSSIAQKASDKYLISAKAGGVNEVVGDVTIARSGGRLGRLFKGDEVQVGEKVTTGADGKAEVLMNPGSYVRLGANSSFEFESTDLDDVRLKMHSGSAVLEVFGAEDFDVSLAVGSSKFSLLETGIYRVDVASDGSSSVSVVKGKVRTGDPTDKPVGKGKKAEFVGNDYVVAKFDRDDKDELDIWSADRAKALSKMSASLKRDSLRDPLISSFWGGRWNLYNTFGLWVYNPFLRSYCFLPFNYGWSPYGYGFGRPIWNYNLPRVIYTQPPPANTPPTPRTDTKGSNGTPTRRRFDPTDRVGPDTSTRQTRDQTQVRTAEPRAPMPRVESPAPTRTPSLPSRSSKYPID